MKKPRCLLIVGLFLALHASIAGGEMPANASPPSSPGTIFDRDPEHLWNRLYSTILLRRDADGTIYGSDSLDLLFWTKTRHLLSEPSYSQAIKVLDEFIDGHGEQSVDDPLKRAVLQRDLWAVFDWSLRIGNINDGDAKDLAVRARVEQLQARLGKVIRRVALSRRQIEALPDNYSVAVNAKAFAAAADPANPTLPFLPPDLFAPDGPWACLGNAEKMPLANQHVGGCSGRSAFFAFLRLPGGRAATREYLEKIKELDRPYLPDPNASKLTRRVLDPRIPNPATPQFPVGTSVALVRQTMLIDDAGELVLTHLTESVQLRVYRKISGDREHTQDFHEFVLNRHDLFTGRHGGLRAVGSDEGGFSFGPQLEQTGDDPFDQPQKVLPTNVVLSTCVMCHNAPGVYSVNNVASLFGWKSSQPWRTLGISSPAREAEKCRQFKTGYYLDRLKSAMENTPGAAR